MVKDIIDPFVDKSCMLMNCILVSQPSRVRVSNGTTAAAHIHYQCSFEGFRGFQNAFVNAPTVNTPHPIKCCA